MKTKKIVQRNLPLDTEYTLIDSWYSSLEENPQTCQNCGAVICSIAQVKSKDGTFIVGMDCAGTLTGLKDSFAFEYEHKARFAQAKQARVTILKAIKDGARNIQVRTFDNANNFYKEIGAGVWELERVREDGSFNGRNWKQYRAETWSKYVLPMIQNLVTTQTA